MLIGDHLVPALTLDAEPSDGLADGDAADVAVAGGESGTDSARVVDGPADVGAGIDAGYDEVERTECAESGEHDAECRGAVDRPGLVDAIDPDTAHLRLHEVQRSERGSGTGVLRVGRRDHDVAVVAHRQRQAMEADGINAVVVRQEQAGHAATLRHLFCP